jgi:hypothetical protein
VALWSGLADEESRAPLGVSGRLACSIGKLPPYWLLPHPESIAIFQFLVLLIREEPPSMQSGAFDRLSVAGFRPYHEVPSSTEFKNDMAQSALYHFYVLNLSF